jgi:hypothetical protein
MPQQLSAKRRGRGRLAAGVFLSLLVLAARAPPGGATEDSPAGAPGDPATDAGPGLETAAGPEGEEDLFTLDKEEAGALERFWDDPTLGGKLHVTYRASMIGRIFDFKPYEYPFPGNISEADREQARQLAERHDDTLDFDLDQYFSLSAKDIYAPEDSSGLVQSAGGHMSFRYYKDIDGSTQGEEALNGFDAFAHRNAFQLYTLYARVETLSRHLELTLGRQTGQFAEWVQFDGATAVFRGLRVLDRDVELSAFGGARVTHYRRAASQHKPERDPETQEIIGNHNAASYPPGIAGGEIRAWLLENTLLELSDVIYIENTFEATLRQEFPGSGWVSAAYRMIDETPHMVFLDATLDRPERGLTVIIFYAGKLSSGEDDFSFDFTVPNRTRGSLDKTVYFNIGEIEPYDELTIDLRKGFGRFGISGGGTYHRLRDRSEEDIYNTDWYEVWGGFDVTDPFWKGLTGRATLRYVHTDLPRRLLRLPVDEVLANGVPDFREEDITGDGEPSHLGLELLVEQSFEGLVTVGATLVLRSYDYRSNYALLDDIHATSVGAYVRWQATERTQWSLGYTYSTDYQYIAPDFGSLHTIGLQFLLRW